MNDITPRLFKKGDQIRVAALDVGIKTGVAVCLSEDTRFSTLHVATYRRDQYQYLYDTLMNPPIDYLIVEYPVVGSWMRHDLKLELDKCVWDLKTFVEGEIFDMQVDAVKITPSTWKSSWISSKGVRYFMPGTPETDRWNTHELDAVKMCFWATEKLGRWLP